MAMKVALAYSEVQHSANLKFRSEVVEPDTGRTGSANASKGDCAKREHEGRTLVLKGRTS